MRALRGSEKLIHKALHPYETPEIVAQNFSAGFAAYLTWVADSTG